MEKRIFKHKLINQEGVIISDLGESPEGIFAATAHDVTPRWRDKRIVSENCLRESFERIRFTSSSELVGETM